MPQRIIADVPGIDVQFIGYAQAVIRLTLLHKVATFEVTGNRFGRRHLGDKGARGLAFPAVRSIAFRDGLGDLGLVAFPPCLMRALLAGPLNLRIVRVLHNAGTFMLAAFRAVLGYFILLVEDTLEQLSLFVFGQDRMLRAPGDQGPHIAAGLLKLRLQLRLADLMPGDVTIYIPLVKPAPFRECVLKIHPFDGLKEKPNRLPHHLQPSHASDGP